MAADRKGRSGALLSRRRLIAVAVVAAIAAAGAGLAVAALGGAGALPPAAVTATAGPAAGPSAGRLAAGHWVPMPPAPVRLCGPLALWDGRDLMAIQPPARPCPLGAAAYDPRANRWTKIAAPPIGKGQWAVGAAGGGRVVVVLNTGAAYSWRPQQGRWRPLGTLPAGRDRFFVAWTGRTFLVTRLYRWRTAGQGEAFELTGRRWTRLPDLPRPAAGRLVEAPAVAFRGAVYVFARAEVTHVTDQNGQRGYFETGDVAVLRLTPAGWTPVALGSGGPRSQLAVTQVRGAILTAGSSCGGMCTQENGSAALLRPGAGVAVTALRPPPGVPNPSNFAAGAGAIVVVYTDGLGDIALGSQIPPGTCYVYDVSAGTWLRCPTAPAVRGTLGPAYWTPDGVISLGQSDGGRDPALLGSGGWLLRPAGARAPD